MLDILRGNKVDRDTTRDIDMHGRRFKNAADSRDVQDFVTRNELNILADSIPTRILDFFRTFFGTIYIAGFVRFAKVATFLKGLKTNLIYPLANGTTAIQITAADGTTAYLIMDTTNGYFRFKKPLRVEDNITYPDGEGLDITYVPASHLAALRSVSISSGTPTYKNFQINGDYLKLNNNSNGALYVGGPTSTIGFFDATPASKQTLNAYTSDGEGSAYSGIDNTQAGTVYAQVADLNQLRVAYETLRASYDDLRTKLKNTTLVV